MLTYRAGNRAARQADGQSIKHAMSGGSDIYLTQYKAGLQVFVQKMNTQQVNLCLGVSETKVWCLRG